MKEQKQMKLTSKYKSTKCMFLLIALSCAVAGCEKDPVTPEPTPTPTPTPTPQPKIVTLVFDNNGHHIELDTIRYYLAQGADSIYMVADPYDMFARQSSIHNATLYLQDRCDISPRVRGHDRLGVNPATDLQDREQLTQMGFDIVIADAKYGKTYAN